MNVTIEGENSSFFFFFLRLFAFDEAVQTFLKTSKELNDAVYKALKSWVEILLIVPFQMKNEKVSKSIDQTQKSSE